MNFLNYNPYGFMTLPQSNPIPMRQPQSVPQIQPPQMMQIGQVQNAQDLMTAMTQANQSGGAGDQIRSKLAETAGDYIGSTLGMPGLGGFVAKGILSGSGAEMPQLLQAPPLSNPMSFSFEPVQQSANGANQYLQTLRGLLA